MAAKQTKKINLVNKQPDKSTPEKLQKRINGLRSSEIIIALSGPVGCGIRTVKDILETNLKNAKYEVVHIKLSDFIKSQYKKQNIDTLSKSQTKSQKKLVTEDKTGKPIKFNLDELQGYSYINTLMDIGDWLREQYEHDILAQHAINYIINNRMKNAELKYDELRKTPNSDLKKRYLEDGTIVNNLEEYAHTHYKPDKIVYIIDQLKNPQEVKLLRAIYGDLFYLIGTLCNTKERKKNLKKDMIEQDANSLMEKDRKESEEHGQQLEKTLQYSDYFVRFSDNDHKHLEEQISRFIKLIHGAGVITPTKDEYGMYVAYSSSLKSACLSRQVGASIADNDGNILSTGCNDVPKFGGGLYTSESKHDLRCHNKGGICYNDDYKKREIRDKLADILKEELSDITQEKAKEIASIMFSNTRLKDLIEFSRAIHAEMASIIELVRHGGTSTTACTLYCTTYPCHNCARHIIAAGLHRVVFIEPYEKSLALDLHDDAISNDLGTEEKPSKVIFAHFEGVAPRKYQYFFVANDKRKDKGKIVKTDDFNIEHKMPEYLYSYRHMETKVTEHLDQLLNITQ